MVDEPLPGAVAAPIRSARTGLGRDTTIDVLRGCFIISMTIAHLSSGSVLGGLSHAAVWLDGAIGFVTLSGLVLGLVYRRQLDRTGRVPFTKALRRARLLYLIQLGTLVLALTVSAVSTRDLGVGRPEELGGWASALGMAATLRLPAQFLDVLPMYVVLLLAAVPALALLSRARTGPLLAVCGAVYVAATVFPGVPVVPGMNFNWAAWQLPFMVGLTVGWHWDQREIAARLRSRLVVALSFAVSAACFAVAQVFGRWDFMEGGAAFRLASWSFDKFDLGPAHLVFGFSAMVLGYAVVSSLRDARRLRTLRTWLSVLGSRSLDAFVILCLAVIVLPAVLGYETSSATAMALVGLTLAVQTGWIVLRRRGYLPGLTTGTEIPGRPLLRRGIAGAASR